MIFVSLEEEKIDVKRLYDKFYENLSDSTGTILIHHGKAKYPGKYVKNYSKINLFLKQNDALTRLEEYAGKMYQKYNLNKLFIVHQLGDIKKNDTVLFLAVESKDRKSAFESISLILEEIKSEKLIGLKEIE